MTTNWNALTAGGKPFLTVSSGATSTSGADFGSDTSGTNTNGIQEALNLANSNSGGSGPARVYLLPGTYLISSSIQINYSSLRPLELVGSGKCTVLQPQSNIDVMQLIAPSGSGYSLPKTRIADLLIQDTNTKQSSTGAIYLNPSNNPINELIVERVSTYNTFHGIYSYAASTYNPAKGIQTAVLRSVRVNNYRGRGIYLYNFYDSVFDDIICTQSSSSTVDAFDFFNSVDSGSFGCNLKALAVSGTSAAGFSFSDIRDFQLCNCVADSFGEGFIFTNDSTSGQNFCDRIHLTNAFAYHCTDDGYYLTHGSGWIFLFSIVATGNTHYGVYNKGNGGNMALYNLAASGNPSGNYQSAAGDKTFNVVSST